MKPPRHLNNGKCEKCVEVKDKYPGFHLGLWEWFCALQSLTKDAHISTAGRGRILQNICFDEGKSKARYGESAHNYNAALDLFRLTIDGLSYDKPWFEYYVGGAVAKQNELELKLDWYGLKGSKFYELPHVEVRNWRGLNLPLVE